MRVHFICLSAVFHAPIPPSLGWPFQRPYSPHARSTIINSRQCHRLAFPESRAEEDESSGLLRTCCIIPFNYCSLDSVQPLIRLRCSVSPQRGQWTEEIYSDFLSRPLFSGLKKKRWHLIWASKLSRSSTLCVCFEAKLCASRSPVFDFQETQPLSKIYCICGRVLRIWYITKRG